MAIKNEKKTSTLEFALIPIIIDLMEEGKIKVIKFSDLLDKLQYYIKGKFNENKPNEYNTEDYGTIYRNTLTSLLNKLGVKTKRHNSYVELLFDHKKIRKTASQYGFVIQEMMGEYSSETGERGERGEGSVDRNGEACKGESMNNGEIQWENDPSTVKSGSNNAQISYVDQAQAKKGEAEEHISSQGKAHMDNKAKENAGICEECLKVQFEVVKEAEPLTIKKIKK